MRSDAPEKDRAVHGLIRCQLPMDRGKRIYVKGVAHYRCFSRPRPCVHRSGAWRRRSRDRVLGRRSM